MGKHASQRAADRADVVPTPPRTRILVLALLVTATLVAWGVLVYAAIDFGQEARSGEEDAWAFLSIASVGAAACLFTTLILGGRILALVKGVEPTPRRLKGGRRAAR